MTDRTEPTRIDVENTAGYDRWATFYDSYPNPTVAADDMAFPAFWGDLQNLDILEIGCGTGRHTVRLAPGNRVTGIDISPGMLAAARAKLPDSVRLINGNFIAYDDFAPASFDVAITSLVLEHIAELDCFFSRLAAVLRPGGRFLMSEIHPARTADGVFAHFRDGDVEYHLTSYPHTPDGINEAALHAGLRITRQADITGDKLADIAPKWARYSGQPMVKLCEFQRKKGFAC